MLFNPTAMDAEISGGGGRSVLVEISVGFVASSLLRFLLRFPFDGSTLFARYWLIGESRLQRLLVVVKKIEEIEASRELPQSWPIIA